MTVYQELQLNQAGSKALIRASQGKGEKWKHILIYNFKIYLTVMFCTVFVTIYGQLFGGENSIVGVVVLLAVLVFRNVDLGFHAGESMGVMMGIFAVLAAGPHAANLVGPAAAALIHFVCIFCLSFFGCHNVIMSNHSTLVLSYLMLYGYDVSGQAYRMRLLGLLCGGIWVSLMLFRKQRKRVFRRRLADLFREFRLQSTRSRWQLGLALLIPAVLLIGEGLGFQRSMWIGFAAMSVYQPFEKDLKKRALHRFLGTLLGCLVFYGLTLVLPAEVLSLLGIAGGIAVGYCATYLWQTAGNVMGAMTAAVGIYGAKAAVELRIWDNLLGILGAVVFFMTYTWVIRRVILRKETDSENTALPE